MKCIHDPSVSSTSNTINMHEYSGCTKLLHGIKLINLSLQLHSLILSSVYTVDMEIFAIKIFSWFVRTTKIKSTKYIYNE